MNKHTITEKPLEYFLRDFSALQDYLAKCGETVVKVRVHVGYLSYRAKVWSEQKDGGAK